MRSFLLYILFLLPLTGWCDSSTAHSTGSHYHVNRGIITVGDSSRMRAFAGFSVSISRALKYSEVLDEYRDTLPAGIRMYCMIVPTAVQYYCPEELWHEQRDQAVVQDSMYSAMHGIIPVRIVGTLGRHKDEAIYSRTDHHWLPLGAYYAAQKFAKVAKVPFRDLSYYNEQVVHDFCGTMPKFGGDSRLRRYPEEFIYYTPKDSGYVTTYVTHTPTRAHGLYHLSAPYTGSFFFKYKDGSSMAYSTFMGGDARTTHVKCFGKNSRRLMIIKNSFGNALPGYLFYSFADIYVVDFRYFQENIVDYAEENGITDLLFAIDTSNACSSNTINGLRRLISY